MLEQKCKNIASGSKMEKYKMYSIFFLIYFFLLIFSIFRNEFCKGEDTHIMNFLNYLLLTFIYLFTHLLLKEGHISSDGKDMKGKAGMSYFLWHYG